MHRLAAYLAAELPFPCRITIAENASTDATPDVADQLARALPGLRVLHLADKGRGLALATAWGSSDALVLAYTDVDLSTGLVALLPLVVPLVSGHSDIAIGTRLARGARGVPGPAAGRSARCCDRLRRVARVHVGDRATSSPPDLAGDQGRPGGSLLRCGPVAGPTTRASVVTRQKYPSCGQLEPAFGVIAWAHMDPRPPAEGATRPPTEKTGPRGGPVHTAMVRPKGLEPLTF